MDLHGKTVAPYDQAQKYVNGLKGSTFDEVATRIQFQLDIYVKNKEKLPHSYHMNCVTLTVTSMCRKDPNFDAAILNRAETRADCYDDYEEHSTDSSDGEENNRYAARAMYANTSNRNNNSRPYKKYGDKNNRKGESYQTTKYQTKDGRSSERYSRRTDNDKKHKYTPQSNTRNTSQCEGCGDIGHEEHECRLLPKVLCCTEWKERNPNKVKPRIAQYKHRKTASTRQRFADRMVRINALQVDDAEDAIFSEELDDLMDDYGFAGGDTQF